MTTTATATPAMRQYLDAKRQHRDAIVLFRMGDFYEMFYEDAIVAARALDLTLTSRSKNASGSAIPMCGVPFHAMDGYLTRLVRQGFRVAICEQVEDPKKAKGLVRREVVRVVSPGTLTDAGYLEAREPAFLMAVAVDQTSYGAALLDLSTGEFTTAEFTGDRRRQGLADDLVVLRPRELLVPDGLDIEEHLPEAGRLQLPITRPDALGFEHAAAHRTLIDQFRVHGLEAFGLETMPAAVCAAGGLLAHLRDTQKIDLTHVRTIRVRSSADCLVIDPTTLRHLELVQGIDGGSTGSLLHAIDRTVTGMGGRLLRAWLLRPLLALEPIRDRLDGVEELASNTTDRGRFREALGAVQDLARLVARVALGTAGPRDLHALKVSLDVVPRVAEVLGGVQVPLLRSLVAELDDLSDVRSLIGRSLVDDPPALARDGGFTREGLDAELDSLRMISRSGRQVIAEMEEAQRSRTGISSLKVRFNRVFGYYIEVSKANLHAVPADYHRKQTVAGGERFTTPALKEHEEKILGADERIFERETEIFESLRAAVAAESGRIQDTAHALASLDVLAGLAETAMVCNYTKPHVHDGDEFTALDARHAVVERLTADAFVPNDVDLDGTARQLVILTGPNMGGKSTYLRQTALLPVLAQTGSFVPAREASVPIVDRIFARVGASDDIARGHSTFMVEMQETAHILHTSTQRSLVVLDEIGRGTSTFDGLSIAWAVAEHLATNPEARPKTLFATHYHELTDLADLLPGVVNAHVSAREYKDEIVFLRKIVAGRSDRSYGIQVARLAGLPPSVVARAREILIGLERDELTRGGRPTLSTTPTDTPIAQLGLFVSSEPQADVEVARRLLEVNLDDTTPMQALALLQELREIADTVNRG